MVDVSLPSPCSIHHYEYKGSPTYVDSLPPCLIHCTLERGAEAYYSGVRVVVLVRRIGFDNEFTEAEIQIRPPLLEKDTVKNVACNDHFPSDTSLPLYTFIFELVDLSELRSLAAEIKFTGATTSMTSSEPVKIPSTHRILYDYARRTTAHSPSCTVLLSTQHLKLPRSFKPYRSRLRPLECRSPVLTRIIGLPTHGFRILPPSKQRPVFIQPPLEILYNIFSVLARDYSIYENWRKGLIAVSLVCRIWWKVALRFIYEDFERHEQNNIRVEKLATVLGDNPERGRYIRYLSSMRFIDRTITSDPAAVFGDSVLAILKTAFNIRSLTMGRVSDLLAEEFVDALCKMTELGYFTQSPTGNDNDSATALNATQLTKCFAHWPKLRQATIHRFGEPQTNDENEFAPARCSLIQITFWNGFVSMAQLRAITASSQDTLRSVMLRSIRGINNKELTSWLLEFGPNITNLVLTSSVFIRSKTDEPAIDATIHIMPKLSYLEVDGPVATVLTLLKFEPVVEPSRHPCIKFNDPTLIDPHAFVIALRTTKWKTVHVPGLTIPNSLVQEVMKLCEERKIIVPIPTQLSLA